MKDDAKHHISEPSTIKVKVHARPTLFNKEMAIGFFAAGLVPVKNTLASLALSAGGMIVGGFAGKGRMENELVDGKKLSANPSIANKDMVLGGLLGAWGGAMATGVLLGLEKSPTVGTLLALMGGGAAIGGVMGGISGKNKEQYSYDVARRDAAQQEKSKAYEKEREAEYAHDVKKDHAKKLHKQRADDKEKEVAL